MRMHKVIITICASLAFYLPSCIAWASEDYMLNFATFGQPPYGYKNEQGESVGYLFEMANAILEISGVPGTNKILPAKRVHYQLKTGRNQCSIMARISFTEERYEMIEPVGKEISIGVIPRSGLDLSEYESLKNYVIAVPNGVSFGSQFDTDTEIKKIVTRNYMQNAIMLKKGRVDAIAGAYDSLMFNLKKIGLEASGLGEPYIEKSVGIWLMCVAGAVPKTVLEKIRNATNTLREDGTFEKIVEKYLGRKMENAGTVNQ